MGNERCSFLARPSGRRLDRLSSLLLGFWAGPGVARRSQRRLLGRVFAGKQVHEGPQVYEPDTLLISKLFDSVSCASIVLRSLNKMVYVQTKIKLPFKCSSFLI